MKPFNNIVAWQIVLMSHPFALFLTSADALVATTHPAKTSQTQLE